MLNLPPHRHQIHQSSSRHLRRTHSSRLSHPHQARFKSSRQQDLFQLQKMSLTHIPPPSVPILPSIHIRIPSRRHHPSSHHSQLIPPHNTHNNQQPKSFSNPSEASQLSSSSSDSHVVCTRIGRLRKGIESQLWSIDTFSNVNSLHFKRLLRLLDVNKLMNMEDPRVLLRHRMYEHRDTMKSCARRIIAQYRWVLAYIQMKLLHFPIQTRELKQQRRRRRRQWWDCQVIDQTHLGVLLPLTLWMWVYRRILKPRLMTGRLDQHDQNYALPLTIHPFSGDDRNV